DIVLLRPRQDFYASGHPSGPDILLVVEVSESSLHYDRTIKGPMYARLGVHEYWIADLNQQRVERDTSPGEGSYRQVDAFVRGELMSPQLLPDCSIAVDDLLA